MGHETVPGQANVGRDGLRAPHIAELKSRRTALGVSSGATIGGKLNSHWWQSLSKGGAYSRKTLLLAAPFSRKSCQGLGGLSVLKMRSLPKKKKRTERGRTSYILKRGKYTPRDGETNTGSWGEKGGGPISGGRGSRTVDQLDAPSSRTEASQIPQHRSLVHAMAQGGSGEALLSLLKEHELISQKQQTKREIMRGAVKTREETTCRQGENGM